MTSYHISIDIMWHHLEVSWNRGTPSHHPYFHGIFHEINHPAIGVPPWPWKPSFDIMQCPSNIHGHWSVKSCSMTSPCNSVTDTRRRFDLSQSGSPSNLKPNIFPWFPMSFSDLSKKQAGFQDLLVILTTKTVPYSVFFHDISPLVGSKRHRCIPMCISCSQ